MITDNTADEPLCPYWSECICSTPCEGEETEHPTSAALEAVNGFIEDVANALSALTAAVNRAADELEGKDEDAKVVVPTFTVYPDSVRVYSIAPPLPAPADEETGRQAFFVGDRLVHTIDPQLDGTVVGTVMDDDGEPLEYYIQHSDSEGSRYNADQAHEYWGRVTPHTAARRAFRTNDVVTKKDGTALVEWRIVSATYRAGDRYPSTYLVAGHSLTELAPQGRKPTDSGYRFTWPAVIAEQVYHVIGRAR